ncbi:MAG: hypothetical protein ACL7AX_13020 [Candidatus Arsenophonus phytopathogenicus]
MWHFSAGFSRGSSGSYTVFNLFHIKKSIFSMKFLPNQKKRLLIFLMLILIIIITAVMFYIIHFPQKINYQTVAVIRGNIEKHVLATGKLDALSKVDVGAQVSGQLQTLYVNEGDMVKKRGFVSGNRSAKGAKCC